MQRSYAIGQSLAVHVIVVAVAWFGLPQLSRDIAVDQPVLTVDIVETVPETNLDEGAEATAEAADAAPAPKEASAAPPPAPPPPAPAPPSPRAESVPIPAPKSAAAPDKPREKSVAASRVAAPPKRPWEKSPEFKKRKQQQALLTSKLQDLTRRKNEQRRRQQEEEDEKRKAREKLENLVAKQQDKEKQAEKDEAKEKLDQLVGQALNTPARTDSRLGVSDIDRLRARLAQCWKPPPGAAGAHTLIVDIIVRFNAKAEVQSVEIEDEARFRRDETFRAAANAARRAAFECSPLPVPPEYLKQWKELTIEFDPRFIRR